MWEWRRAEGRRVVCVGWWGKNDFSAEEEYLLSRVLGMAPAEEAEWMADVVAEAVRAALS